MRITAGRVIFGTVGIAAVLGLGAAITYRAQQASLNYQIRKAARDILGERVRNKVAVDIGMAQIAFARKFDLKMSLPWIEPYPNAPYYPATVHIQKSRQNFDGKTLVESCKMGDVTGTAIRADVVFKKRSTLLRPRPGESETFYMCWAPGKAMLMPPTRVIAPTASAQLPRPAA